VSKAKCLLPLAMLSWAIMKSCHEMMNEIQLMKLLNTPEEAEGGWVEAASPQHPGIH